MNVIEYALYRELIPAHREAKILEAIQICRYHDILNELKAASSNDALDSNPYHNYYHTCCMIVNADAAVNWYNRDPRNILIDIASHQELLIACIFHDIGHTAGQYNDTVNIAKAMGAALNATFYPHIRKSEVLNLIAVTEFPFIRKPTTLTQQIIRDCDLLQVLEPDWAEMIFVGLYTELKNNPKFHDLTPRAFFKLQVEFLHSAEFFTEWFDKTKRTQWSDVLQRLEESR